MVHFECLNMASPKPIGLEKRMTHSQARFIENFFFIDLHLAIVYKRFRAIFTKRIFV